MQVAPELGVVVLVLRVPNTPNPPNSRWHWHSTRQNGRAGTTDSRTETPAKSAFGRVGRKGRILFRKSLTPHPSLALAPGRRPGSASASPAGHASCRMHHATA